jgi:von Willebrand factor type A domain
MDHIGEGRALKPFTWLFMAWVAFHFCATFTAAEGLDICEIAPKASCLDRAKVNQETFVVPVSAMGFSRDALSICDSTFLYTSAPDVILILDNTGSMAKVRTVGGLPRYCSDPADPMGYTEDPGCLSGDPDTLRAKALQAFVDSALAKGGAGTRIGIILFSDRVLNSGPVKWNVLDSNSVGTIRNEIVADADGATNYYAAFKAAVELLQTSTKPKDEQTIIFVSDGRPNRPLAFDGGPYLYKQYLDKKMLPPVHSIFLGDQSINFADLKDISNQTGGLFFAIRDVSKMAGILTDSIAKQVFKRALPTATTVTNATNKFSVTVGAAAHEPNADTTAYTLHMPGPLALSRGVNDLILRTQYGNNGPSLDLKFKVSRAEQAELDTSVFSIQCRARAEIQLLDASGKNLSSTATPYGLVDSQAVVQLTTRADLDTFPVLLRLSENSTARSDLETLQIPDAPGADSIHLGSLFFAHQANEKVNGNGVLDGFHGDRVIAEWRNPWLPEDTAITFTTLRYGPDILFAAIFDKDGDGRAETVQIRLGQELARLPDRIRFRMKDGDGQSVERIPTLDAEEIAFEKVDGEERPDRLVITLSNPFPATATTTDPKSEAGHFFRQDDIPLVDVDFAIDDSIGPAIQTAEILETDRAHSQRRIQVRFTEPVTLDSISLDILVFKRDTLLIDSKDIPIDHIEKRSDTEFDVYLLPGANFTPVGGDSVAIVTDGKVRDAHGRAPSDLHFQVLQGKTPTQSVQQFFVTFADGSRNRPSHDEAPSRPSGQAVIPLDSTGTALQGNSGGKCGSCRIKLDESTMGSLFHIVVPGPVQYELTVFSNLGAFVNRFSGEIEEKDLRFLSRRTEGEGENRKTFYEQTLLWNGLTASGQLANTGAYVLRAVFRFDRNLATGAKATTETQFKRFGFMRTCCLTSYTWEQFDFKLDWP